MLSKIDIQNEIGKNINIYPLSLSNIKENSINLSASSYAWSLKGGDIYTSNSANNSSPFSLNQTSTHKNHTKIAPRSSAVIEINTNEKYIVLFPHSTTLIETAEVLSVGKNIGGTYHSKVGLVSQGIGHIGTMVGPNFSGESLIAIHNVSNDLITIKCGDSFVSVVFHYLDTSYEKINPTVSGHTDKFSELGITLTPEESAELNADWKKQHSEVKHKLQESTEYKELQKIITKQKRENFKNYFNKKNVVLVIVLVTLIVGLGFLTHWIDVKNGNTVWGDRYWNVCLSGALVSVISIIFKHILEK